MLKQELLPWKLCISRLSLVVILFPCRTRPSVSLFSNNKYFNVSLNGFFLRQVMPFLLRRTKDEVLTDLPEKIIQDRYCDLSPVQLKLYEKFSGSHAKEEISSMVEVNEPSTGEGNASPKASTHIFQVSSNLFLTFFIILTLTYLCTLKIFSGTSILAKVMQSPIACTWRKNSRSSLTTYVRNLPW